MPNTPKSLDTIFKLPLPQYTEIIGNGVLIEESKAVLYGVFKVGKSTLLDYVAMAVAGGIPLFNSMDFQTKPSKVLLVNCEIPYKAQLKKLKASQLAADYTVQRNLHLVTEFWLKLDHEWGKKIFEDWIKLVQPDLVVLDPLYKLVSGSDSNSEDMSKVFDVLDMLMAQYHFSVLFSAQGRKSLVLPKGGVVDMGDQELRGSTAIPGWVDSIIGIRGLPGTKRKLSLTLRHGSKESWEFAVDWDRTTGLYTKV